MDDVLDSISVVWNITKEDELEGETEHSMYKADGKLHEQERDVAKYWKNGEVRIALYGLENQTSVDADMPLRVLSYDGAAYRNQLNQDEKVKRYPVITLVLYFGDGEWNKPKNLLGCLDVPEKLKPFVNDYQINVFKLMQVLTNDNMFGTMYNLNIPNGNGGINMDDFLSTLVAKGKNEGKAEIIQELVRTGRMTIEQIADMMKLPVEKVKELAEMVIVSA